MLQSTNKNELADAGRLKIVILGEAGVGKSTFTQSLKATTVGQSRPVAWTIGCSVEVIAHNYRAGTPQQALHLVELWDVGGSRNHANSRHVFYQHADGAILMHDLSNRKSESNLRAWAAELVDYGLVGSGGGGSPSRRTLPYTAESGVTSINDNMPTLIVGSKLDLIASSSSSDRSEKSNCISLDCRQPIASGSTNRLLLTRFFDSIIDRQAPAEQRRRRYLL